jgi:hypothetical protein
MLQKFDKLVWALDQRTTPGALILELVGSSPWQLSPYLMAARSLGTRVILVTVTTKLPTAKKRCIHAVREPLMNQMHKNMQEPLPLPLVKMLYGQKEYVIWN